VPPTLVGFESSLYYIEGINASSYMVTFLLSGCLFMGFFVVVLFFAIERFEVLEV
jgi:hypothetical protein